MTAVMSYARSRLGAVVALAAASVASTVFLGTSVASSSRHRHHFTVVSQDARGSITPADFGSSPAQNQQASADSPVTRGGRTVGDAQTVITITRATKADVAAMIECTVELPGGTVMFNGAAHLGDLAKGATLPVLGGTGAYTGASGTVTMKSPKKTSTTLMFDFTTP